VIGIDDAALQEREESELYSGRVATGHPTIRACLIASRCISGGP
jgi:hypothetical protein